MIRRLGSHFRNQWTGVLALFLVLAGGTAYALDGVNTVDSGDIIDNQVKTADVRDDTKSGGGLGAVDLGPASVARSELDPAAFAAPDISRDSPTSAFEVSDNAIQHTEVTDGTLTGVDVASNSLTGLDINESTLIGFDGHDAYSDLCDTPEDNSYRECISVTFDLGHAMQVLVISGGGGSSAGENTAVGQCKTTLDGADKRFPVDIITEASVAVGMATLSDVMALSAGTHTIGLSCRENPTDVHFEDLSIGVVELGFD